MDAEHDLTNGTSPAEPHGAADRFDPDEGRQSQTVPAPEAAENPDPAPARPRPTPADMERLQQLLTEFSATPVFAWMLADWTGPAASILVGDAKHGVTHGAYVVPDAVAAPQAAAQPAAPRPVPAYNDEHGDSPTFSAHVSGGLQSTVVAASGDVRPDTVGLLTAAVLQALGEAPTQVVVDLREVTHFSTAGLRALVELRDAAADVATDFRLRAPSNAVRQVIEARSGEPMFQVDEDEDASDQSATLWSPPSVDDGDEARQPQHVSASRGY